MFVSIYKVWAKLFTFLSIKICSVACVLNQIRAYHYAYIRFSILERSILQANIDIPRILIYACIPYFI